MFYSILWEAKCLVEEDRVTMEQGYYQLGDSHGIKKISLYIEWTWGQKVKAMETTPSISMHDWG